MSSIATPINRSARIRALAQRHASASPAELARLAGEAPKVVRAALKHSSVGKIVKAMKHRKVPRWVTAATSSPFGSRRTWMVLSDMIGRLEVRCDLCHRHGSYRVDRLLAEFGDLSIPEAMDAIARRAGCPRILKPPSIGDISYATSRCQIQRVVGREAGD